MSMRIQELHPALVHFPIALLPASLAADALGAATGSRTLLEVGRRTIPMAAASAAVAGVFGLIAQQAVELDDETTDLLITHRNINIGAIVLTAAMAAARGSMKRPSLGYLATGLAGLAAVTYSAYLGGHMVYDHGVGVRAAGGLNEEQAPDIQPSNLGEASRTAARHVKEGAVLTARELGEGKLAPSFLRPGTHGHPSPRKAEHDGPGTAAAAPLARAVELAE